MDRSKLYQDATEDDDWYEVWYFNKRLPSTGQLHKRNIDDLEEAKTKARGLFQYHERDSTNVVVYNNRGFDVFRITPDGEEHTD